ncbi:hypothetical protein ACFPRL_26015 [Pseudoclavibacter helvolus]
MSAIHAEMRAMRRRIPSSSTGAQCRDPFAVGSSGETARSSRSSLIHGPSHASGFGSVESPVTGVVHSRAMARARLA